MRLMLDLIEIQGFDDTKSCIDGKYVPARPENFKNRSLTLSIRAKRAWLVFTGKADCFMWPGNQ